MIRPIIFLSFTFVVRTLFAKVLEDDSSLKREDCRLFRNVQQ